MKILKSMMVALMTVTMFSLQVLAEEPQAPTTVQQETPQNPAVSPSVQLSQPVQAPPAVTSNPLPNSTLHLQQLQTLTRSTSTPVPNSTGGTSSATPPPVATTQPAVVPNVTKPTTPPPAPVTLFGGYSNRDYLDPPEAAPLVPFGNQTLVTTTSGNTTTYQLTDGGVFGSGLFPTVYETKMVTRDAVGRVTAVFDSWANNRDSYTFTYNQTGRLIQKVRVHRSPPLSSVQNNYTRTWRWDDNGNLISDQTIQN